MLLYVVTRSGRSPGITSDMKRRGAEAPRPEVRFDQFLVAGLAVCLAAGLTGAAADLAPAASYLAS